MTEKEITTMIDPICGRDVHPKQSEYLLNRDGKQYHFCCAVCRQQFLDQYPADARQILANNFEVITTMRRNTPARAPQPVAAAA